MQLYFARHAQSFNNDLEGHADYFHRRLAEPPLTQTGNRQAEHLANLFAGDPSAHDHARKHRLFRNPWNHEGFDISHIYCSLQRRAVETARPIAETLKVNPVGWADLHECGGVVEYDTDADTFRGSRGATADELRSWLPTLALDDIDPEGWWSERPMENNEESVIRANRVYHQLLEQHGGTDDRVLLVSHSMFYVFLVSRILEISFKSELWFTLNNAALSRFDIGDGVDYEPGVDSGWREISGLPVRVTYLNRLDHLPVELVT